MKTVREVLVITAGNCESAHPAPNVLRMGQNIKGDVARRHEPLKQATLEAEANETFGIIVATSPGVGKDDHPFAILFQPLQRCSGAFIGALVITQHAKLIDQEIVVLIDQVCERCLGNRAHWFFLCH